MPSAAPTFVHERVYWQQGIQHVAGLDEVGVGALAGPVVAGAVVFDSETSVQGIRDSKQLSSRQRAVVVEHIKCHALAWAIGEASVAEISSFNIRGAARLAMQRAVAQLACVPDFLLVDGLSFPGLHPTIPHQAIVGGDRFSLSIAAASIVAKEYRDELMRKLSVSFPEYGFAQHKGYATAAHKQALGRYGATPCHRATYAPVSSLLTNSRKAG